MTDQEALEAFLQSHEWEWQPGDMAYYKGSAIDESPFLMLNQSKESIHWWGIFRLDCKVSDVTPVNEHLFPWAGLWIEGRLREMMGRTFVGLIPYYNNEWRCDYYDACVETKYRIAYAPTPIQALLKALEMVKMSLMKGGK